MTRKREEKAKFLKLLNKDITEEFILEFEEECNSLSKGYLNTSMNKKLEIFNDTQKDLQEHLNEVVKGPNYFDYIFSWLDEILLPARASDDIGRIVPSSHEEELEHQNNPWVFVPMTYAIEIDKIFNKVSLLFMKKCRSCGEFFISERTNTNYCSISCKRRADLKDHGTDYYEAIKRRRKRGKGKYLPKRYILCTSCRSTIALPKLEDGTVDHSVKNLICSNCSSRHENPYWSKP